MSISRSPAETEAHAAALSRGAAPGLVIGLAGDLGAGKTHWVRGFARALGFAGRVHSPTFTLLNAYEGGRWPLFHLDLYRLTDPDQVRGAGLEEYLPNPAGVTLVEWIERWLPEWAEGAAGGPSPLRPPRLWIVRLAWAGSDAREITHECLGS